MGGAQVLLCWLVHYFLTTNIKMIVACPPGPLLNKLTSMGIETYEFRPGLFSFLQIALIMRATRPSIIHIHLLGAAMCGTIASFLAYSSKLVFTVHNPPNYPGMKFWRQYASLVILRLLSLRIDKFIAVSREIESFLANRGRISPDKLKLIYNGVSFPTLENASSALRVSKKELGIPKDGQVIGTVGRISFAKGQDILIEAFRSLAPEFPKLHCVIVGEGELRHNIETLITKHEIQDRVHLTGFKEDVLSWYRSMDIIVFPSRFEGLPLSVIEAAYASKPIVATNIGGIKEIIQNEVSGLLVPPVDPLALAKAIRKLLENPSLALKLGRSAQTSVTDRFNIRKCGVRTMKMYRDLVF